MATQALAANGAKVYITGRRMEVLENAAKAHCPSLNGSGEGSIVPIGPCDVTKKADLSSLVDQIRQKESHINLLIVAAGIAGPKVEPDESNASSLSNKLWDGESVEAWQDTFNTDVTSVYFTTVAFLPLLQAAIKSESPAKAHPHSSHRFAPSVITISSMSGIMRDAQGHFSYNAAKGATVSVDC
jgi:NAD(P)-dependent dehydrogenase (short-subunit alcohol dehydrogenase family)